jgi:hypothetical protein
MLIMTHPSRNFFVLSLLCVLYMFVRIRVQGFERSVHKVFQKEKLDNSKTIIYSPNLKWLAHQELTYFTYMTPPESSEVILVYKQL